MNSQRYKLVLLATTIVAHSFFQHTIRAMHGEIAQAGQRETKEALVEEKAKLEEKQHTLLEEQKQATPEDQPQIKLDQEAIAEELAAVNTKIAAAVPDLGGGGTRGQVTSVSEQKITGSTSLNEWQENWKVFAEKPGFLWGKGGELYNLAPEEASARMIDVVTHTPLDLFAQDPVQAITALASVAEAANDMQQNKKISSEAAAEIITSVTEKLSQVMQANKPWINGPTEITQWQELYTKIDTTKGLPDDSKRDIQEVIVRRTETAIDEGKFGDTASQRIKALHELQSKAGDFYSSLSRSLSDKMIKVFDETHFSENQTGALNLKKLSAELIKNISPDLKETAQEVIAVKAAELLSKIPVDVSGAAKDLTSNNIIDQYKILNQLPLTPDQFEKISQAAIDKFNALAEKTAFNPTAGFNDLIKIAKYAGPLLSLDRENKLITTVATKLNEIVLSELDNHTLITESIAKITNPEEAYATAYAQEAEMLTSYLNFTQVKALPEIEKSGELATAKRLTRLDDFLAGQEAFAKSQGQGVADWAWAKTKSLWSTVASAAEGAFKGQEGIAKLIQQDKDFADAESKQKSLFALGRLEALPEDILMRRQEEIDAATRQISQAANPQEFQKSLERLLELNKQLEAPLITSGDESYGFKELLAEKQDIDRFNDLSNTMASKVINAFDAYLDKTATNENGLGTADESRKTMLDEMEAMRELLLSDPVFKSKPEAASLLDKIDVVIKNTRASDIQESARLGAEVEKAVSDALKLSAETIADMKPKVDALIRDIENLLQNSIGISDAGLTALQDRLQEASAWSGVIDIAAGYRSMFAEGADADAAQKIYTTLSQNAAETARLLDYRQKMVFTDRIAMMQKQQKALAKIVDFFSEQKAGNYTMVDLGQAMDTMVASLIQPNPDMIEVLKSQGLVTETSPGMFEPTVKGVILAEITRENSRIVDRSNQIKEFTEKNKTPPGLTMERGGKPIKLAEELKLSWLILDDQLQALKQKFLEAGRDPIKDTIINIENAIRQRVDTFEEGLSNIGNLLGMTADQLKNTDALVQAIGLTRSQASNLEQFAVAVGILSKDMTTEAKQARLKEISTDPLVLGKYLGLTDEQIVQQGAAISLENPKAQRELLRRELVRRKLQEQVEQSGTHGDVKLSNTLLMGDIADILAELRDQSGKVSADPRFEALVALRRKMLDMSPEEAEKFKESERFLSILGALDGKAALEMDPRTVTQEMKSAFVGMGYLIGDGFSGLATQSHKLWIQLRQGTSFIAKLGALPVAALTYILTRMGISTAWQAGTKTLTGAATVAGGPLAGILAYAALPGAGFLPDIVGILAGTAAGGLLYYVGNEINPSKEQLEKLNEELVAGGFDPVKIAEGSSWTEASKEWITNFFKTDVAIWAATADRQKEVINRKAALAEDAKAKYYEMLGLAPTATEIEYQAALTAKQAEIEASWGVNRWLIGRRYNNAYQFMLRANFDVVNANAQYMTILNEIQTKAIAAPARQSESIGIEYGWNRFKGAAGDLYRWMTGTTAEPEKGITLSAEQFSDFRKQLDHFYGRQVSDLMVMKDFIEKNKDEIKKASPFGDDTYITSFQSLIDGRVAALRDEYEAGVKAILKEHGIKTAEQIGATS